MAEPQTTDPTLLVKASDELRATVRARPLAYPLDDYWLAPQGGDGDVAYDWKDKPHRVIYDLVAALLHADEVINGKR